MQTGLVQDGNCTYYLSEEKGAGYGQMVCNQTINIDGLKMTFNATGALVDMQYDQIAAVKTLQDAMVSSQQPTNQAAIQVGPAVIGLSSQVVGLKKTQVVKEAFGPHLDSSFIGPVWKK